MKNNYKFWIIISCIIIFVVGAVAGIFLEDYIIPTKTKMPRRDRHSPRFPTLEIMAKELSLTPDQEKKIREIFDNNEVRIRDLRSLYYERLSNIRTQLKSEIESVLTEEQKTKFEAMIERYIQRRKKEGERWKKYRKEQEK